MSCAIESELVSALGAARREAMNAFGDDTVYLEKLIERPRHIEIQILADSHGNVIHLGERECSIQRRHQKLIEESPSVAVDEALRQQMGELSVQAARAVNYVSAGTLEFLLDQSGNFYFLEMNTRLQVEHPVTERVTGVDIVKEMITIAAGRRMRLKQEDIRPKGWAIECRITAEDPINNFMPSGGKITTLQEPTGPGVRVESGIYEGFEVSLFYDPMIAKLICWGETRAEALLRMRRALNEYRIGGIKTSIPFHQQILSSTQFMWGTFDTNFLEERFSMTYTERPEMELSAAIAAALVAHTGEQRATVMHHERPSCWFSLEARRRLEALRKTQPVKYIATITPTGAACRHRPHHGNRDRGGRPGTCRRPDVPHRPAPDRQFEPLLAAG